MEKIQILHGAKGYYIMIDDKPIFTDAIPKKENVFYCSTISEAVANLKIYIDYFEDLQNLAITRQKTTRGTTIATTGEILYTPYITPQGGATL